MPNLKTIPFVVMNPSDDKKLPMTVEIPNSPRAGCFVKRLAHRLRSSRRVSKSASSGDGKAVPSHSASDDTLSLRTPRNVTASLVGLYAPSSNSSTAPKNPRRSDPAPKLSVESRKLPAAKTCVEEKDIPTNSEQRPLDDTEGCASERAPATSQAVDPPTSPQSAEVESRSSPAPKASSVRPTYVPRNLECDPLPSKAKRSTQPVNVSAGHLASDRPAQSTLRPTKDVYPGPKQPAKIQPEIQDKVDAVNQQCPSCGLRIFQCRKFYRKANNPSGASFCDFPAFDVQIEECDHRRFLEYIHNMSRKIPQNAREGKYVKLYLISRRGTSEKQVELLVGLRAHPITGEMPVVCICRAKRADIVFEFRDLVDVVKCGGIASVYLVDGKGTMFGALIVRS
ncbi:hypothetical protein K458DRAFT_488884 [Lentithecium fluviatile CBS 122367]|uniref:Uncharacterized protein n=1 Tax=Lentithecium fluviatile CBS 122367 TaxID=1168545 RepID=A0A6G1IW91_9PLEO|nr:hypothetical protein K458DRAFT_488884 [Lentithecium fluviatile CBS 122367]